MAENSTQLTFELATDFNGTYKIVRDAAKYAYTAIDTGDSTQIAQAYEAVLWVNRNLVEGKPYGSEVFGIMTSLEESELDPEGLKKFKDMRPEAIQAYYRTRTQTAENRNGLSIDELFNTRSLPGIDNHAGPGVPMDVKRQIHNSLMGRGTPYEDAVAHAYTTSAGQGQGPISRGLSNMGVAYNIIAANLGDFGSDGKASELAQLFYSKADLANIPSVDMGTLGGQFSWLQGQLLADQNEQDRINPPKRPVPPGVMPTALDAPERQTDTPNVVSSVSKAVDFFSASLRAGQQGVNPLNTKLGRAVFSGNSNLSEHLNLSREGNRIAQQFAKLEAHVAGFQDTLTLAAPGLGQADVIDVVNALAFHVNAVEMLGVFRADREKDKEMAQEAGRILGPYLKFYEAGNRAAKGVGTPADFAAVMSTAGDLFPPKVARGDEPLTLGESLFKAGKIDEDQVSMVNANAEKAKSWVDLNNTRSVTHPSKALEQEFETQALFRSTSKTKDAFRDAGLAQDPTRAGAMEVWEKAADKYRRANLENYVAPTLTDAFLDGVTPGVRGQRLNDPENETIDYSEEDKARAEETENNYNLQWAGSLFGRVAEVTVAGVVDALVPSKESDAPDFQFPFVFRGKTPYDIWNTDSSKAPGGLEVPFREQFTFKQFQERFEDNQMRIPGVGTVMSVRKMMLKPGIDRVLKARLYDANLDGTVKRRAGAKYTETVATVEAKQAELANKEQNITVPGLGIRKFDLSEPDDHYVFWNTFQAQRGSEAATYKEAMRAVKAKKDYQESKNVWDDLDLTSSDYEDFYQSTGRKTSSVNFRAALDVAGKIYRKVDKLGWTRIEAVTKGTVAYQQKRELLVLKGRIDKVAAAVKAGRATDKELMALAVELLDMEAESLGEQGMIINPQKMAEQVPGLINTLDRLRIERDKLRGKSTGASGSTVPSIYDNEPG